MLKRTSANALRPITATAIASSFSLKQSLRSLAAITLVQRKRPDAYPLERSLMKMLEDKGIDVSIDVKSDDMVDAWIVNMGSTSTEVAPYVGFCSQNVKKSSKSLSDPQLRTEIGASFVLLNEHHKKVCTMEENGGKVKGLTVKGVTILLTDYSKMTAPAAATIHKFGNPDVDFQDGMLDHIVFVISCGNPSQKTLNGLSIQKIFAAPGTEKYLPEIFKDYEISFVNDRHKLPLIAHIREKIKEKEQGQTPDSKSFSKV